MSYNLITTRVFEKNVKALSKKYPSLKTDLRALQNELQENPKAGIHLGNDIYKILLAIKSKAKGKSGGARVITYVRIVEETVYLLSIYDKSQKANISEALIKELIKQLG